IISFYPVANFRSVSKAAHILELGQPTVTTHLQKLESEFGITLFDRIKRPIQLTSEGAAFLRLVTPIVEAVDALKIQVDYPERRGSFVVGAYPDLVMHHLPRAIQSFLRLYPEIKIRLRAQPHLPLVQLVKSGEVDIALSSRPPANDTSLEFLQLFEYNMVLVTPPEHELLEARLLQLQDIAQWPLILFGPESSTRLIVEQALKDQKVSYNIVLELDNTELIKRYVEIGMGVSMCTDFALHPGDRDKVGVAALDHLFPNSAIGICTLKGKFQGRIVRNFIDILVEELSGFRSQLWDRSSLEEQPADLVF
ncbi:MAG: LysR family transcriptional regulator, partial [Dehalococcoidia bacterium]